MFFEKVVVEGFTVGDDVVVGLFAFLAHGVECRAVIEMGAYCATNTQIKKTAILARPDV
jgi:hypothetical protein